MSRSDNSLEALFMYLEAHSRLEDSYVILENLSLAQINKKIIPLKSLSVRVS